METMNLNRIKIVLAEKNKKNAWLAEQLGCSVITVSKWCTNSMQPTVLKLHQIARLLGVSVKDLLNDEEV